mgnify:CR=1 FL=1
MDEHVWTDRPLTQRVPIGGNGCVIALENAPHLTFVSGRLDMALSHLCPDAPLLGLAETSDHANFAMRIARDHAVLSTSDPVDRRSGWQPEGFALSSADDRYAAISLRGHTAEEILCRGLQSTLPRGSVSCAVRFARKTVLITGLQDGFTLWVDQADLTYSWTFLTGLNHD